MVGFKRLKAVDPREDELRRAWHEAKDAGDEKKLACIGTELSDYIWKRSVAIIEEDRRRHPKAKRNQGKSETGPSGGRVLP